MDGSMGKSKADHIRRGHPAAPCSCPCAELGTAAGCSQRARKRRRTEYGQQSCATQGNGYSTGRDPTCGNNTVSASYECHGAIDRIATAARNCARTITAAGQYRDSQERRTGKSKKRGGNGAC